MITRQENVINIIKEFGTHDTDSGSTTVQIALLTDKINSLQGHLKTHKKDFSSQRGLMQMVNDRKSLLLYLRRIATAEQYQQVISRLGIRK